MVKCNVREKRVCMKKILILLMISMMLLITGCKGNEKTLFIATTTSLDNSGLLDYLIPHFEEEYGINCNVVAVGTGAALELGKEGQVEILLVHDIEKEVSFINDGFGTKRTNIMYNDFILIGPSVLEAGNLEDALQEIVDNHQFYSRGDESGTHSRELSIWSLYGYDVSSFTDFYYETGQGMGSTITMADLSGYFTLSDRATYLSMLDNISLVISYENPNELKNQYGVIKVNPDLYNKTDEYAELFYNWIIRDDIQDLITEYKVNDTQLFYID